MSNALTSVQNLADCLLELDDSVISFLAKNHSHLDKCVKAASLVKNPSEFANNELTKPSGQELETQNSALGIFSTPSSNSEVNSAIRRTIDAINSARNNVIDVMNEVTRFISRAKSAGFVPPQNPFLELARLNSGRSVSARGVIRELRIEQQLAEDILYSIDVLLKLRDLEKRGEIDFDSQNSSSKKAQISSFSLSLDGFKFSTDSSVDLLSFLPDADALKRKRIEESLSSLSFNKRIPKLLFTCNFDPDDSSKGTIVGFKKMPDASGYIIKRTAIFTGETKEFRFSNSEITREYSKIKSYVKEWVLSFYDSSVENSVLAFVDNTTQKHHIYKYSVKGYQISRSDKNFIFDVNLSKGLISKRQLDEIELSMKNTIGVGSRTDRNEDVIVTPQSISPYPFISSKIYTTDKFDWIISAINVRSAIKRGESRSVVRSYSYLGSTFNFVKDRIEKFKFFLPANVDDVINNVTNSISTYGVSQTLLDVFESTGLIYFMSNKEDTDDDEVATFSRPDQVFDDPDVSLMSDILKSIDAETATVNVKFLLNNLSKSQFFTKTSSASSEPTEITVGDEFSEDPLQFIEELQIDDDVLDLATFDGISSFVRIIRAYFDNSPDRKR